MTPSTSLRAGRVALALVALALTSVRVVGGGAPAQAPPLAAQVTASPCAGPRVYSGAPIDVDFQGSDLRTTLRLLADTGGINLVLDPSVPPAAKVDIKLTQVPWDQVLDVILRGNALNCVAEGAVIRVLARDARTKELDDETRQRKASEQVPELEKLQLRLNYADAEELKLLLVKSGIVSARGTVEIDKRTKTVIVKDTPRNLQDVQDLIRSLDLPEPQVEIEAQIIETDNDSARALGIQWGVNGRMSQELGNTTGLAFPNSGTVGGRTGAQQGAAVGGGADPRATGLEKSSSAVNLGATAPSSALGLTLGALNGAFNLDVAISALEHKGRIKILSKPKVTTQNNREALIMRGFDVPYQTISNNTVVVMFRPAALRLHITPQVTAVGTVLMKIELSNDFPDFSRSVNGNPSINTQQARTEVQVADGMTTVIGGINRSTEETKNDRTPGVGNIPLFGWLFRRNEIRAENQELFIFITPRVLRGRP